MKRQTSAPTRDLEQIKASFIVESVENYLADNEIFDALRSLRFALSPAINMGIDQRSIDDLQGLEMLLLDIAEAQYKTYKMKAEGGGQPNS